MIPHPSIPSGRRPLHDVVVLGLPVVVTMASQSVMGLVDVLFMRWVGVAEQGAVGLGSVLSWTMLSFFAGTLTVVSSFVAQELGAGRPERTGSYVWQSLWPMVPFAVMLPFSGPLVHGLLAAIGTEEPVASLAAEYAAIRLAGSLFVFAGFSVTGFYRGLGEMRLPMWVTLGQNVLNAGLDALLVFGAGPIPPLGLAGAAWATVAATAAGTILFFALFLRSGTRRTSGSATSVRPDRTGMVEIARVGAPVGFSWLLEMAVWTIFTIYAAGLGKTPLAAHNIVMNVVHFSFLPGVAISITASTLVGQQLGADRPDVAERYAWAAMRACLMWMGTMGIVMVVFRHPLAAAFSSDPEVRGTAARVFLWAAAFQLFDGAGIVSSGTLRGAGDTRYPAVVSIATAWLVFLPAIHLLGTTAGLGIDGAWLAADIHLFVMGGLMVARLRRGGWKRLRLVGPPTAAGMTVERT